MFSSRSTMCNIFLTVPVCCCWEFSQKFEVWLCPRKSLVSTMNVPGAAASQPGPVAHSAGLSGPDSGRDKLRNMNTGHTADVNPSRLLGTNIDVFMDKHPIVMQWFQWPGRDDNNWGALSKKYKKFSLLLVFICWTLVSRDITTKAPLLCLICLQFRVCRQEGPREQGLIALWPGRRNVNIGKIG